ncbi:hypothetical protein [Tenacibaculum sp. C7A-26P2]|uniref:hypothetical protein n=1 Tax=Tenacibaculum sp. C7A-26P2 TaxID=3447504 RepID=UPI003F865AA8
MKKIFYLLLVLGLIIPLQAQRQSRSARHLKNGEYKARRTAVRNPNFPDTRNVEGLDNISFNYSSSLQTIANNEHLIQMAAKRKLRRWLEHQKNNRIKPEIEGVLGKRFSNFNDAKNTLFNFTEKKNLNTLISKTRNRYSGENKRNQTTQNNLLKELKILQHRENELKGGNRNNALYADRRVNNIPVQRIVSIPQLSRIRQELIKKVEPAIAKYHVSNLVNKKLNSFNSEDHTRILNSAVGQKHQYYNHLNDWSKLDYIQSLIFKIKDSRRIGPYLSRTNSKFQHEMLSVAQIQQYAEQHREGGFSVFDSRSYSLYMYNIRDLNNKWISKKNRELANILSKTAIGATSEVDYLINTYRIKQPDRIQWLNENYRSNVFRDMVAKTKSLITPQTIANTNTVFNNHIKTALYAGGKTTNWLNRGNVTNELHRQFFYTNAHASRELDKLMFFNDPVRQTTIIMSEKNATDYLKKILAPLDRRNSWSVAEAQQWALGQIELDNILTRITVKWQPATGRINGKVGQEYTHRYSDGNTTYYKMTDGAVVINSDNTLVLNKNNQLVRKLRSEAGGKSWYIKPNGAQHWSNYLILGPSSTKEELEVLFELGTTALAKFIGSVIIPVEDVKVLIDGKDFDGQTASRWLAAGLLVVEVVPGGKLVKVIVKATRTKKAWKIATKIGDKVYISLTKAVRRFTTSELALLKKVDVPDFVSNNLDDLLLTENRTTIWSLNNVSSGQFKRGDLIEEIFNQWGNKYGGYQNLNDIIPNYRTLDFDGVLANINEVVSLKSYKRADKSISTLKTTLRGYVRKLNNDIAIGVNHAGKNRVLDFVIEEGSLTQNQMDNILDYVDDLLDEFTDVDKIKITPF